MGNIMQKNAITITVTTLVIGIFGAFIRWLQTMNAFEKDTGLLIRGAGTTLVYVIYSIVAIGIFCVLTFLWLRQFDRAENAGKALGSATVAPVVLTWIFCGIFVAASCLNMFTADLARFPTMQRLLGAGGIFGGLCFPFLYGKKGSAEPKSFGRTAAVVVTLFYCYWLIFCYRTYAEDPTVWRYAIEILGIAASTVGLYYLTTYFFGAGKLQRTLILVQTAAYFNISTLFDPRPKAQEVMIIISAGVMLLTEYILIENLWEKTDRY